MSVLFTPEQADRTLPLVRRIVEDLIRHHARWSEMIAMCDSLLARSSDSNRDQVEGLQGEIQRTATEIDRFLRELSDIGAECKGFEQGLVDFPAEMDGRRIWLCWKPREERVEYWHEIDAGFEGRQLLVRSGL